MHSNLQRFPFDLKHVMQMYEGNRPVKQNSNVTVYIVVSTHIPIPYILLLDKLTLSNTIGVEYISLLRMHVDGVEYSTQPVA